MNFNHPSFITFLETITNNIMSQFIVKNYFDILPDKKVALQYTVLKLIYNSINVNTKLVDEDILSFINILWKKNEKSENYELAGLLKDIYHNFNSLKELSNKKKLKIEKNKMVNNEKK